jgi:hypothetical protein
MKIKLRNRPFTLLAGALLLGMVQTAGAEPVAPAGLLDKSTQDRAAMVFDPIVRYELIALRNATIHFHRFENAAASGWNVPVSGCVEHPELGGMGYHFGNLEFYMNGKVNLLEPEVLLYEPKPNGKLSLVGLEYVVPAFAWEGEGFPHIFGDKMTWMGGPVEGEGEGDWIRHVWLWKHNPAGMFADFNPRVNCNFADD